MLLLPMEAPIQAFTAVFCTACSLIASMHCHIEPFVQWDDFFSILSYKK